MSDREFLALSSLFDAIGIIEKGIEKIYHYLLKHKRIDNLNEVSTQFNLTLKRGYKICAVLNDLGLVQIYDRPMKIHLTTPPISIWQTIINERIEELSQLFQEKKEEAENALSDFIHNYNLSEQITQEFVEFVNYNLKNIGETYHSFLAEKECKIALGIRYENEFSSVIKKYGISSIPEDLSESMKSGITKIKENLINIDIQVIFSTEVINELLVSEEFQLVSNYLKSYNLLFKNISVRVTDEDFSNFNLTDSELVQPSFDPTNKLIGAYLSRNTNIYKIFYDKFNELYEKGIPLTQYLKEQSDIKEESYSKTQLFGLCLL
jgi:predicted DNA-binding transcriptional regulator